MALTSVTLRWLVVAAAVLLFAATLWLWPRLAGHTAPALLGRVALLLGTQCLLLAAIALQANASFGFYASWADLFGVSQPPGVVIDEARTGERITVTGSQHVNVPEGAVPAEGGRIEKVTITGPISKISSPAYVYLPPEYFQPERASRVFPAALVLAGYPGTPEALVKGLKYPQTAHELISAGTMQPTILVLVDPTVAPPRDTECVDVPGGPRVETFFTEDLPAAVASHYRTGTGAGVWGVIGSSTGGYCALKMAMRHPEAYSAAVGLSPSYRAPSDATTGDLFGGDERLKRENDLMWRLDQLPAPPVSLLVASSKHGERDYRETLRFIQKVKERHAAGDPVHLSSMILDSGGHNFNSWRREIPAALTWLAGHLKRP